MEINFRLCKDEIKTFSLLPNPGCTGAPDEEFDMLEFAFDPDPVLE